jgi:hypothetical protein
MSKPASAITTPAMSIFRSRDNPERMLWVGSGCALERGAGFDVPRWAGREALRLGSAGRGGIFPPVLPRGRGGLEVFAAGLLAEAGFLGLFLDDWRLMFLNLS